VGDTWWFASHQKWSFITWDQFRKGFPLQGYAVSTLRLLILCLDEKFELLTQIEIYDIWMVWKSSLYF